MKTIYEHEVHKLIIADKSKKDGWRRDSWLNTSGIVDLIFNKSFALQLKGMGKIENLRIRFETYKDGNHDKIIFEEIDEKEQ